jgi:hypothetical protein
MKKTVTAQVYLAKGRICSVVYPETASSFLQEASSDLKVVGAWLEDLICTINAEIDTYLGLYKNSVKQDLMVPTVIPALRRQQQEDLELVS